MVRAAKADVARCTAPIHRAPPAPVGHPGGSRRLDRPGRGANSGHRRSESPQVLVDGDGSALLARFRGAPFRLRNRQPRHVYRHTAVDGQSSFVHSRSHAETAPRSACPSSSTASSRGTGAVTKEGAPVLGSLTSDRMQIDPDGSFTITVDSEPADGRPNHIRTTAAARLLIARDSLNSWAEEQPSRLEIERTAGPTAHASRTPEQLAKQTADLLRTIGRYWLDGTTRSSIPKRPTTFRLLQSAVRASDSRPAATSRSAAIRRWS